jgi:hypothetical protein
MVSGYLCVSCAQSTTIGPLAQAPRVAPSYGKLVCCAYDCNVHGNLHFTLDHGIDHHVLALGDLDDFLNQACS